MTLEPQETRPRTLVYAPCGAESDNQALLGGMEDDSDDPLEALILCPDVPPASSTATAAV